MAFGWPRGYGVANSSQEEGGIPRSVLALTVASLASPAGAQDVRRLTLADYRNRTKQIKVE